MWPKVRTKSKLYSVGKAKLAPCISRASFEHLTERWRRLFAAKHEVFLDDLTSTYLQRPPPEDPEDIDWLGYFRDKRDDCVQVWSLC